MIQLFGLARIGRDVETRSMSNGDAVANVSLAFS
jgi:single-strand DNA-binding protein